DPQYLCLDCTPGSAARSPVPVVLASVAASPCRFEVEDLARYTISKPPESGLFGNHLTVLQLLHTATRGCSITEPSCSRMWFRSWIASRCSPISTGAFPANSFSSRSCSAALATLAAVRGLGDSGFCGQPSPLCNLAISAASLRFRVSTNDDRSQSSILRIS